MQKENAPKPAPSSTANLENLYKPVGIQAISAATLCKKQGGLKKS